MMIILYLRILDNERVFPISHFPWHIAVICRELEIIMSHEIFHYT